MTEVENLKKISDFKDNSLLIVDDDNPFRERLARAMEKKGFQVSQAEGVDSAILKIRELFVYEFSNYHLRFLRRFNIIFSN